MVCAAAGRSSAGARGAKVFRSKHSRLGPVAERRPAVRPCFGSMCSSQLCKALPMHVSHDGLSWKRLKLTVFHAQLDDFSRPKWLEKCSQIWSYKWQGSARQSCWGKYNDLC